MLSGPFVGNNNANLSAKDVEVELKVRPFVIQSRKIDKEGLKIESAGEIQAADRQAIVLLLGRAALSGKSLSNYLGCNGSLVGRDATGFDLIPGNGRVALQDVARSFL